MLIGVWERSGEIPPQLARHGPEPPAAPWIWRWFNEIPSPITWREIRAWSETTGIRIERWEAVLLMRLDQKTRTF